MAEKQKITKRQNFMELAELIETHPQITEERKARYLEFIAHEIDLLDKKAQSKGTSKTNQENEGLKAEILEALTKLNDKVTITEFQTRVPEMAKYSNQKLSALFRQLILSNEIEKIQDKKKSYFKIAG